MFINITASETGNNKGSSGALVNYLEKENHIQSENGKVQVHELWFNGIGNEITRQEVRVRIDGNVAKLSRNDSKFFLINISPSQKELAHLYQKYGEDGVKGKLKEFAVGIMDGYAKNFKRAGIESNRDLLWYGKHENYRYFSHTDKEVKDGIRQRGDQKEGRQDHIQIIVSRKDITNMIKLSPMNTSRGRNRAHSAKLGEFNRTAFKELGEILLNKKFNFNRRLKDTMGYANTMKNGTSAQKAQMEMLDKVSKNITENVRLNDLGRRIAAGEIESIEKLFATPSHSGGGILKILLEPAEISPISNPIEEAEKRRRKRQQQIDQSHGLGI